MHARNPFLIGNIDAPHTLEFYYDIPCPFSQRSFKTVYELLKLMVTVGSLKDKVKIYVRLLPQPFHASSSACLEMICAVAQIAPESTLEYMNALYADLNPWKESSILDKTLRQVRSELAAVAAKIIGEDKAQQAEDAVTQKSSPNYAPIGDDFKFFVKLGRQNGIHFTPTVLWDGLINDSVSSSWGEAEWTDFFSKNVKA